MKSKFFLGLIAALILFWVASAFGPLHVEDQAATQERAAIENADVMFGPNSGDYYHKEFTKDTLNDAEIDIKSLPNFLSNFQMCATIEAPAAISGTRSIKLCLDENNSTANGFWRAIDSTTLTTGYGLITLRKSVAECPRYRIRVVGASTEAAPYTVIFTAKKLQ
jgi:hypothetical protein